MYYFDDYETFERDWIARNISYIDDFETDKNLSHKEKFLFYGPYCMAQKLRPKGAQLTLEAYLHMTTSLVMTNVVNSSC